MKSPTLTTFFVAGPSPLTPSSTSAFDAPSASSPSRTMSLFETGSGSENWSSLIGIITAIVGNVLISFALNMQRYAHIRLEREWQEKKRAWRRRSRSQTKLAEQQGKRTYHPPRHTEYTVESESEGVSGGGVATEASPLISGAGGKRRSAESEDRGEEAMFKQKSYLKSPYWWTGIILMTTGEAGNFLAYGFAPASIVSPLGVVALISNCIIAPVMLHEPFRKRDILGVLVAVAGAVTVVASASDNNPKLGPGDVWSLITTWEFETYLGITVAVIVGLMVASNRFGDKSVLIDLGLVGLFGGYTALSTKGVASMLSYTLWRAITFPVTYLLVAILVFTAVMQIKYVNRALQRFDSTQVIPVQFVLFTLSVILGSAILYRDFERTSGEDAGKFVGGCAMTFLGVWFITSGRTRRNDEDDEDREPEDEDAINLVEEPYLDDVDVDDTAEDSSDPGTRHSSTVRETSPPIAISRRRSSGVTRTPSHPSTPTITLTPTNTGFVPPRTPTSRDGSHPIPNPLTTNPWQNDSQSPLPHSSSPSPSPRPPAGGLTRHPTLSTPLLPSEAQTQTNPQASTSSPDVNPGPPLPHTPTRGVSDHAVHATPHTTPHSRLRRMGTVERLGGRNSIAGPLLASPLSTSLSALVADIKRGGSLRSSPLYHQREHDGGSSRRRESVLGLGERELGDEGVGQPLDRRRTHDEGSDSGRGRGRSLSGTLSDIWGKWRTPTDATDEEAAREEER